MRAPPQRNLLVHALPEMQRLAEATSQSCHLTVASGSDIVVVARVESPDTEVFSVRVGHRRPLNQSASGPVLFAYQSATRRAAWQALLSSDKDRKLWAAIEHDVQSIRDMGFYLTPQQVRGRRNRHRGSDYRRQERNGHCGPGHALYRGAFRQAESDASGHGDPAGRPADQPRAVAARNVKFPNRGCGDLVESSATWFH